MRATFAGSQLHAHATRRGRWRASPLACSSRGAKARRVDRVHADVCARCRDVTASPSSASDAANCVIAASRPPLPHAARPRSHRQRRRPHRRCLVSCSCEAPATRRPLPAARRPPPAARCPLHAARRPLITAAAAADRGCSNSAAQTARAVERRQQGGVGGGAEINHVGGACRRGRQPAAAAFAAARTRLTSKRERALGPWRLFSGAPDASSRRPPLAAAADRHRSPAATATAAAAATPVAADA